MINQNHILKYNLNLVRASKSDFENINDNIHGLTKLINKNGVTEHPSQITPTEKVLDKDGNNEEI